MKRVLVVLLGRNTEAILKQATEKFSPIDETIIVARNTDTISSPQCVKSKDFHAINGRRYIVIANGGTTEQLLSVDKELSSFDNFIEYEFYDMQKNYCKRYKFFKFDRARRVKWYCECGSKYSILYTGKKDSILLCGKCGNVVKINSRKEEK